MAKSRFYIFLSGFLLFISCNTNDKKEVTDSSGLLFQKSVDLINLYVDSIRNAKDSLQFQTIVRNFNWKITTLNYDFPPDTDLLLSEEENDSLIKLYKKLERVKMHQDSVVMNRIRPDSISESIKSDSIVSE
ncbi:MAG: hypothetical protein K2M10_06605 [Muribaculaceae bacterium]|nr:hypothetical protein [Muribaculaceae bacterium]MDE6299297.1 hypothetical protein [Muribaculaceae bacterium]